MLSDSTAPLGQGVIYSSLFEGNIFVLAVTIEPVVNALKFTLFNRLYDSNNRTTHNILTTVHNRWNSHIVLFYTFRWSDIHFCVMFGNLEVIFCVYFLNLCLILPYVCVSAVFERLPMGGVIGLYFVGSKVPKSYLLFFKKKILKKKKIPHARITFWKWEDQNQLIYFTSPYYGIIVAHLHDYTEIREVESNIILFFSNDVITFIFFRGII